MPTILLIDDNDSVRQATRLMLEKNGHDVAELASGCRAVTKLQAIDADLVITDLVMPGREGIETIMALREAVPEVPVIAISGGGRYADSTAYLRSADQLGATLTLEKPFSADQLDQAVAAALKTEERTQS